MSRYWKAIIAAGGMLLIVLNSLVGQSAFGPEAQSYINLGIAVLTPLLVWLKANEPA